MATKKQLVESLAKKLDYLSEEDARLAVDGIFGCIEESLVNGDRIELRGFGSLSTRKRKYADRDEEYNAMYYRMSKNIQYKISK